MFKLRGEVTDTGVTRRAQGHVDWLIWIVLFLLPQGELLSLA